VHAMVSYTKSVLWVYAYSAFQIVTISRQLDTKYQETMLLVV
jgi:hypothetical protein